MHPKIATLGTTSREKINVVYEWFVERIKDCGGSYQVPKLDMLANEIGGISRDTISKYLKQLVRLGLLVVSNPDNKKWRYATYSLPVYDGEPKESWQYDAGVITWKPVDNSITEVGVVAGSATKREEEQQVGEPPPEQQVEEVSEVELVPYIEGHSQLILNERRILDFDLAPIYGVSTSALNRAYKRNLDMFEDDWVIQLDGETWSNLCQSGIGSETQKHRDTPPLVYNAEGANSVAFQLKQSPIARKRTKTIIKVFSDLERMAHGEEPKQPGFVEMLTAVASGFGVLRGELDAKVSIPVFEVEKQRLLAGMEELAGKVHQTTVRDDNFQKDLDGYRIKLDNTITRLMEEKAERLKMQDERRRQAELRRLYQHGQIYGAMIGNRVNGGGYRWVWNYVVLYYKGCNTLTLGL